MAQSQTPTTDAPTPDEWTADDLARMEFMLKQSMAKKLASLQESRAFSMATPNLGTARSYAEEASALRKVRQRQTHPRYKPLMEVSGATDWLTGDYDDLGAGSTLEDVTTTLHEAGDVDEAGTLTDRTTVPGQPSPGYGVDR